MLRMPLPRIASLTLTLLAFGMTLPAHAELFTSSASSAGSASSASLSDSIGDSSGSSSEKKKVAEGQYRVMEVAQAPDRPETTRLTLRATEPGRSHQFTLYLPDRAQQARPLRIGDLVKTQQRPYGFEFAHVDTGRAFFLVLTDDWQQDLDSKVVTL